ncbi:MAG TPA: (d)CMP kinase [Actinomycetota bacterium]|nr:(d)CMP kinase [Actinomycetota bacterium]
MNARVVAIDGAAGSGKSTLARALAERLDLPYLNTGLMYRALAAAALARNVDPGDGAALLRLTSGLRFTVGGERPPQLQVEGYDEPDLVTPEVEAAVSEVASHPEVREWMRDRQRALGEAGAVMEGRDIGSVVFPDAAVKLYLVADPDARGRRRASERPEGEHDIVEALRARDARDHRTVPLDRPPKDAVELDTGELDVQDTIAAALEEVRRRAPGLLR